jgi:hypothetical protein
MDKLEDLPVDEDSTPTEKGTAILNKFFTKPNESKKPKSKWADIDKWKLIGYAAVLFVLLANPFTQDLLHKAPYFGGNGMSVMLLSLVLYVLILIALVMFA